MSNEKKKLVFVAFATKCEIMGGMNNDPICVSGVFSEKYEAMKWMRREFAEAVQQPDICYAKFSEEEGVAKVCGDISVIVLSVKMCNLEESEAAK